MAVLVNAAWVREARKTHEKTRAELVHAVQAAFGFSTKEAAEAVDTASNWMGRNLQERTY